MRKKEGIVRIGKKKFKVISGGMPKIIIRKKKGLYCVLGERIKTKGTGKGKHRGLGCYSSKKKAIRRRDTVQGIVAFRYVE